MVYLGTVFNLYCASLQHVIKIARRKYTIFNLVRTVPTFVTAHMFCASRDILGFPMGGAY